MLGCASSSNHGASNAAAVVDLGCGCGLATAVIIDVGLWTGGLEMVLSPVAVVVIQIAYMVFVAPLALFGWWAASER
jgi:hypothetical protein